MTINEIVNSLITIRDIELEDKPMMQNRAAYNINLLINELSKSPKARKGTRQNNK
jgi:hypothetical protein